MITNYADDNSIYRQHENIDDLITSSQGAAAKRFKWFSDNQMKEIHIGDNLIESSTCEKLLGIKIDSKLRFDDHIQELCKKS